MKNITHNIITLSCIISILITTSCSTTKEVIIQGIPGTTIYTRNYDEIGVIGAEGTAKITMDTHNAFYLSKAPGSQYYIPFATNIKDKFNGLDDPTGMAMLGCMLILIPTFCLASPLVFQADKPLDTCTNDDLFISDQVEISYPTNLE